MRRAHVIVLLAALALGIASAAPAGAATPTAVSGLAATVSGTNVSLSGTATFGGEDPIIVADDPVNDNLGGANTAPLGVDLDGLFISQPDPNAPSLQFTIDLNGMTSDGIPEHVAYNWDIRVDGGEALGGADRSIKTWRTRVATTTNTSPYAAVFTCVPSPTGGSSCTPGPTIPVTYNAAASEIRLTVPLAVIQANPGSTIDAWNRISAPVWIGGTAGTQTLAGLYDTATHAQYIVPKKEVRLGIAPAGSAINHTTTATLSGNSFSGVVSAGGAGSFNAGARACFGGNCGAAATTVAVG